MLEIVTAPTARVRPRSTAGTTEPAATEPGTTEPAATVVLVDRGQPLRTLNRQSRRKSRPRVRIAVAVIVTVGSAGAALAFALRPGENARAPASAVRAVPVDRASVTATASSTQAPDGDVTYAAANTLDGDPATAWNSNGGPSSRAGELTLTYRFTRPVDLRDITIRNGYQKANRRDLYRLNERVHRVRVVTDAGRWTWDLADARAPQTFTAAAGRTGSVRLEVVSTYPSTAYSDVALSEVAFTGAVSAP